MGSRSKRIASDIRFWLWRAKTMHAARYLSLVTIAAMLLGLGLFSGGQIFKKADIVHAANGAVYTNNLLTIDGRGFSYYLVTDTSCGGSSLWPLNTASAALMTNGSVSNFHGKLCLNPANTTLVLTNEAKLSIVGSTSFSSVVVDSGAVLTTAPADAKGKAAQYPSRSDYYAMQFTGFIRLEAGRAYAFWPYEYDDAMTIEMDTTGNVANALSVDNESSFGGGVVAFNHLDPCSNFDRSFTGSECGSGGITTATKGAHYVVVPGTSGPYYYPIRITTWEVTGGAVFSIHYTNNGVESYLPVSMLYAPQTTGVNAGKVDTAAQGKMRFEYATPAQRSTTPAINRTLSNSGGDDGNYAFFDSVDLSDTGTFNGFGKVAGGQFRFSWNDGDYQTASNPLSNSMLDDGIDYRLGARPSDITKTALLSNYKLQTHNNANTSGIDAKLDLTALGDMTLTNSIVSTEGKGLPGGFLKRFSEWTSDDAVSGVGGQGQGSSPGWWTATAGDCENSANGSIWSSLGGGGGGGGSTCNDSLGSGGGGGGAIGFGAPGTIVDSNGTDGVDGNYESFGHGGAGFNGIGGGLMQVSSPAGSAPQYKDVLRGKSNRFSGTSARGYYSSNASTGMGGGGGGSAYTGAGGTELYKTNIAGSGGGVMRLSVNGNLTAISGSTISAAGEQPSDPRTGGGGGGTLDIKVVGSFALSNDSTLSASGGSTIVDPVQTSNFHMKGGEGGGGLVRIRAGLFDNNGWPDDYCSVAKEFLGYMGGNQAKDNIRVIGGSKTTKSAEAGIIDLAYVNNSPFCSSSSSSATNVTISKQIQQYTGTRVPPNESDVSNDGEWSNVATVVPDMYIRVHLSVRNPSDQDKNVQIADSLPIANMVFNPSTLYVKKDNGNAIIDRINVGSGVSSFNRTLSVPKKTTYHIFYSAKVESPF